MAVESETIKRPLRVGCHLKRPLGIWLHVIARGTQLKDPEARFRILSLDGGGVRGYLSASILTRIETHLNLKHEDNKPLGEHFDLIVGTSIGGIIALALAAGKRAADTAAFIEQTIPAVFGPSQKRNRLHSFIRPKYSSEKLTYCLKQFFEHKSLRDMTRDVCVTAVSLQNAAPRFYKTDYLARNSGRLDEEIVNIALGTSAAPTYFKAQSMKFSNNLVDGGLCANNPALVGLVDGFQFERPSKRGAQPPQILNGDVMMLSVGTGEQPSMPYEINSLDDGGTFDWARPISEVVFESQSQLIHHQAKFLLGERYLRINPRLRFPMALDDWQKLPELKNLADMTAEIQKFIDQEIPKSRFQERLPSDNGSPMKEG